MNFLTLLASASRRQYSRLATASGVGVRLEPHYGKRGGSASRTPLRQERRVCFSNPVANVSSRIKQVGGERRRWLTAPTRWARLVARDDAVVSGLVVRSAAAYDDWE